MPVQVALPLQCWSFSFYRSLIVLRPPAQQSRAWRWRAESHWWCSLLHP